MDQAESLRVMMKEKVRAGDPLRVIGIVSGKGGVGKSNLSANLAILAAKAGKRVLILDADLGLANVEILYGMTPKYHLGHVLEAGMPINEVLANGPKGVKVLPAGNGLAGLSHLDDSQKMRLVAALDSLEDDFDVILIDSGAGIGENVMFFTGAAQEALLVVSPEPTSLTDAYAAVKVLSQNAGVRFFNVVVNQSPGEIPAREIFQKLLNVSNRFLDAKLRYLGWVPRDENLHRSVMTQRPLVELFPHSPASRAMGQIAETLFNGPAPVNLDGGLKFLWNRLFKETGAMIG